MKQLMIDHVTIASDDLEPLRAAFAELGLATDYGGSHSNGITHMALLGFRDGSYIELISSLRPNPPATAFWSQHIAENGGPCAWAIQAPHITHEAQRVAQRGIPILGPNYYHRQRPDGVLVEWELAFLGENGAGATLPFMIKDLTPRDLRVQPSASVVNTLLVGVSKVILGVTDLTATSQLFQDLYHWAEPYYELNPTLQAQCAYFPHSPVILARPAHPTSPLAQRLAQFGPSPWGYLLGTTDFAAAQRHYPLTPPETWLNHQVAWFDNPHLPRPCLGIIGNAL